MLLMERFYQNVLGVRGGTTPAQMPTAAALREAQIWLREVTAGELAQRSDVIGEINTKLPADQRSYEHPYHWAAFTFSGA
jgi:CHAT domain-containing protein